MIVNSRIIEWFITVNYLDKRIVPYVFKIFISLLLFTLVINQNDLIIFIVGFLKNTVKKCF